MSDLGTSDSGRDTGRRVGILTFHFVPNYGAVWQIYALQEALTARGHRVSVVDYQPAHVNAGGRFWLPTSRRRIRANLVIAYQKYLRFRARFGRRRKIEDAFAGFRGGSLRVTGRRYRTVGGLRRQPPQLDAVVCGSDQIWNPSAQFGLDPAYFADFGPAALRRVAYAASFGRGSIEGEFYPQLKTLVDQIDHVSTREPSGAGILARAGVSKPVATLPDPTLLWDEYPVVPRPAGVPEKYLFSYVLRSGDAVNAIQRGIAGQLELPVVTPMNPHTVKSDAAVQVIPTPEEWLALIRNASAVITNSFHGTLFSIILRRPFVVVGIGSGKGALNERARSLLERLGLTERFVTTDDVDEARRQLEAPIDWDAVQERRDTWRAEALAFLDESLRPTERTHG